MLLEAIPTGYARAQRFNAQEEALEQLTIFGCSGCMHG
jgi:hypothetical protein